MVWRQALSIKDGSKTYQTAINNFKTLFFEVDHQTRTQKHISDPLKNSAAKRINMFLRWMVRNDKAGVDFGSLENTQLGPFVLSFRCAFR